MKKMVLILCVIFFNVSAWSQRPSCAVLTICEEPRLLYNGDGDEKAALFVVNQGEHKYGIADNSGNIIVPLIYDDAFGYNLNKIIAHKWRKSADMWDIKSKTRIKLTGISAYMNEGIIAIETADEKWGYCDDKGKMLIPAKYTNAEIFINGKAIVTVSEKMGLIDLKGRTVIAPTYDELLYADNGLYIFGSSKDGKTSHGVMTNKGEVIIPSGKYEYIDQYGRFFKATISADKEAFFNFSGKLLTKEGDKSYTRNYKTSGENGLLNCKDTNGKIFVLDTLGNRYLENRFNHVYAHTHQVTGKATGLYTVQTSIEPEEYDIVKLDGTVVVKGILNLLNYDDTYFFLNFAKDKTEMLSIVKNDGSILVKDFAKSLEKIHKHYIVANKDGKFGAVNFYTGEIVIPFVYTAIEKFDACKIILEKENGQKDEFNQELKKLNQR